MAEQTVLSTDLALQAFSERPQRIEPLQDLAAYYREKGMNEAAMMFAAYGLGTPFPNNDLLFVETDAYSWGLKREASISGFYSQYPAMRELAHRCCDELSLARDVPVWVREEAWRNLFFYTRPLVEQAPSFKTKRIHFDPPSGYQPLNPSVCLLGSTRMVLNIRTVNYLIGADGRYIMPDDGVVRTRNFLFDLDFDLEHQLLNELQLPADVPEAFKLCMGFEDIRLFTWQSNLWFSATSRQHNPEGWCEIVSGQIGAGGIIRNWKALHPPYEKRAQKNWMPIIDGPGLFVYSCDPLRIITGSADDPEVSMVLDKGSPSVAVATNWGGSSQVLPFDDGYLCLIHERQAYPDPMRGQRDYQRRFVFFDQDLNIRRFSRRFRFGDGEGEFCCGMCRHPDGERLVISYGVLDREAWLATVTADDVRRMLQEPSGGPPGLVIPQMTTRRAPEPSAPQAASAAASTADPVRDRVVSWVAENTNRPLQRVADIEFAASVLTLLGLPLHPDRPKAWDTFLAVHHAANRCDHGAPVLDAGVAAESAFLPGLYRIGFTDLVGINLDEGVLGVTTNGVRYQRGDITATEFTDKHFGFVACLSVIEHGVDWRRFLAEMKRIIRPGGHLLVSFDYWQDPVDTGGRMAFGSPIKIFDAGEVQRMVDLAVALGFEPTHTVDLECSERAVNWTGMDFTFMALLLRAE